jgi:metal-responsive CopG/Arc/MetJ family transcriptional regulator
MRTTVTLPDDLAEQVKQMLDSASLSEFIRDAVARHVEELQRKAVAEQMAEGYVAESREPSWDSDWQAIETEGWE